MTTLATSEMDEYSRRTVELLLERHPVYLEELLSKMGIYLDVRSNSVDSICSAISDRSRTEKSGSGHESSIYTCDCGSRHVITREVQTRSSDEGSSILHICTKCGKKYY